MVHARAPVTHMVDPLALTRMSGATALLLQDKQVPKFAGNSEDWPRFGRVWKDYESILREAYPGLSDKILLRALGQSLNQTCQTTLERLTAENPDLTFRQFWAILDREFGKDITHLHREAWVRTPLTIKGRSMTLEEFRAFEADFLAKGALVTDKRDNEEWDLLNLKLPPHWKGRLLEQESNQCANKFWVRVSNLPDIGPKKLQRLLERSAHIRIKKFKTADGSILYECRSESDQGLLLDLDGSKVGGKKIQVVRGMVHMSVSEAFAWIKRKLGTIEEAKRYETEMSVRAVQHGDSFHEGSEEEYGSLQTQSAPNLVGPVRSVQQQSHSGGSQGKGGAPKRSGSNPQSSQHQAKPPNSSSSRSSFAQSSSSRSGRTGGLSMYQKAQRSADSHFPPPPIAPHVLATGAPIPENVIYPFKPAPHRIESLRKEMGSNHNPGHPRAQPNTLTQGGVSNPTPSNPTSQGARVSIVANPCRVCIKAGLDGNHDWKTCVRREGQGKGILKA